jgi:DNA helicase-2/ATP-dependent DNA helicase PcrA
MLEFFEKELQRTSPDRIAFMTFTRAARLEALERSKRPEEELPWVKTIHAICYKLTGTRQADLVTKLALKEFGKKIGVDIRGTLHDPWSLESVTGENQEPSMADRLLQLNHLGRHKQLKLKEMLRYAPTDIDFHFAKWFTETYRGWKHSQGLVDYTDLLTVYLQSGSPLDVDVGFIDEAQDLSLLQWAVARKMVSAAHRLYLAGDDDQAIFTWAGASPDAFNSESVDESTVLEQSYRVPKCVHTLSESVVRRIRARHPKSYLPRDYEGEYSEVGSLGYNHLGDASTFVLFRNHYRGLALSKQLEEMAWPYSGPYSPLDNQEAKGLLSVYRSMREGHDVNPSEAKIAIAYTHMHYLRGHAEATAFNSTGPIGCNLLFNKDVRNVPFDVLFPRIRGAHYITRVIQGAGIKEALQPSMTLMSIHQSKGRQANTVILDLEMSRRTFEGYLQNPDDEHRVWYVAITRTRERLITLLPNDSSFYKI